MPTVRVELTPRWPLRLPPAGVDGVMRRREGVLERLLHVDDAPVVVTVEEPEANRLLFVAEADSQAAAQAGIERMRFAVGADDDLRDFHDRFRDDALIGRSVRARPCLRPFRRPDPFEALVWGITEQLIEFTRATAIQRRIVRRFGRQDTRTGLWDTPTPAALSEAAPAELQAMDLSAGRSVAMIRVAREVARGRIDLNPQGGDVERGWVRLRAIPGIGAWTVEILALHGQGRFDQLPAGDLAYLRLVGRLTTGNPRARVEEPEVRNFFAPYAPYAALAGAHALRVRGSAPVVSRPVT